MRTLYVKKLKETFHNLGVQLPTDTVNLIDDHIDREIYKMAIRCKHGNVKRLTPELFWVALGKSSGE